MNTCSPPRTPFLLKILPGLGKRFSENIRNKVIEQQNIDNTVQYMLHAHTQIQAGEKSQLSGRVFTKQTEGPAFNRLQLR